MLNNPQPHIRSLRNKYNDEKSIFKGLLHKFVSINYVDGRTVTGEVIGVYNERVFMWHPRNRDTLALFKCNRPDQGKALQVSASIRQSILGLGHFGRETDLQITTY